MEMVVACLGSPEAKASRNLEKKMSNWMKEYDKSIKLLLIGAGESGKTTIIKQMKILHIKGFSEEEKKEKALEIRRNVLESIVTLCQHLAKLGLELADSSKGGDLTRVLQCGEKCGGDPPDDLLLEVLNEDFYTSVAAVWQDDGIKATYAQQHQFQLIDCAKYFLDKVDTIRDPEFNPTAQDILNSRRMTTDIQKIEFDVQIPKKYGGGHQTFWMFDVGGQKGHRDKWIQVFAGIQAVLFLVAANCYDLVAREDDTTNRLKDSIDIFETVWGSRFLDNAGFILFLNKQDKLREKVTVEKNRIDAVYPEYNDYKLLAKDEVSGEDPEYIRTRCFIRDMFLDICKAPTGELNGQRKFSIAPGLFLPEQTEPKRTCYHHFTTATDTNNIKIVFNDVHNMIIMLNLSEIGIN